MSETMPEQIAAALGQRLYTNGFRPLPDLNNEGKLIGTRLWRVRAGYVEYLALRPNGLAQAARARALFNYHQPAEHGMVIEHRAAYAPNALDWLLNSSGLPGQPGPRPYIARD